MKRINAPGEMAKALKFGLQLCEDDFSTLYRTVVLKSQGELPVLTPRDTGWASKHWSLGVNKSHEQEEVSIDSIEGLTFGDRVKLFNNVPYIKRLDEGWSMQKPQGFTHIAKARAENLAKRLSKKLSLKVYKNV